MTPNSFYAAYAARNTAVALGSYVLLRAASLPAPTATLLAMAATLVALAAVTVVEKVSEQPNEILMRHVRATRLLSMAVAAAASCMAATRATGQPLWFVLGFFMGIGYGVYALRKEIDDYVAPSFLLFATLTQSALIFAILS